MQMSFVLLGCYAEYICNSNFGPQKDALRGRHFADDDELKYSVREELRHFGEEFLATGTQRLRQMWEKGFDNYGDFLEK